MIMTTRKDIQEELEPVGPQLARMIPQPPYQVPGGYFDTLAANILRRVQAGEALSSAGTHRESPDIEEEDLVSPVLRGLKNKPTLQAPDGYFDTLRPAELAGKATGGKKHAPVVRLSRGKMAIRYAAAAAVAGIIVISAWLLAGETKNNADPLLAGSDAPAGQQQWLAQVRALSDREITAFVEGNDYMPGSEALPSAGTDQGTPDIGEEDLLLMLADIPDNELEKYLERSPANL